MLYQPVDAPGKTIGTDAMRARPCPHNPAVSCSNCRLSDLCLPIALNKPEIEQLDNIIERNRPLGKSEHLYRQRDEFRSVYAVRSGSFKSYTLTSNSKSRVTGFYMPGEILDLTLETVSRGFSSLQKKTIISVKSRKIAITDMAGLKAILGD